MECLCSICFEEITSSTGKVELACKHAFHYRCLTSWFYSQVNSNASETCPYCRREVSDIEQLPGESEGKSNADAESDSSDSSDLNSDWALEFYRSVSMNVRISAAQEKFAKLRESVSEDEFKNLVIIKIQSVARRYLVLLLKKRMYALHLSLDALKESRRKKERQINRLTPRIMKETIQARNSIDIFLMGISKWKNLSASKIQVFWRGCLLRKRISLRITWRRIDEYIWERTVHNPNESKIWNGASTDEPPASLAIQTTNLATKIQSIWRGRKVRTMLGSV